MEFHGGLILNKRDKEKLEENHERSILSGDEEGFDDDGYDLVDNFFDQRGHDEGWFIIFLNVSLSSFLNHLRRKSSLTTTSNVQLRRRSQADTVGLVNYCQNWIRRE